MVVPVDEPTFGAGSAPFFWKKSRITHDYRPGNNDDKDLDRALGSREKLLSETYSLAYHLSRFGSWDEEVRRSNGAAQISSLSKS